MQDAQTVPQTHLAPGNVTLGQMTAGKALTAPPSPGQGAAVGPWTARQKAEHLPPASSIKGAEESGLKHGPQ